MGNVAGKKSEPAPLIGRSAVNGSKGSFNGRIDDNGSFRFNPGKVMENNRNILKNIEGIGCSNGHRVGDFIVIVVPGNHPGRIVNK